MHRNLLSLAALVALQAVALQAHAVSTCAAGSPNASVTESTPASAFSFNGDGTVTHGLTGLVWKQCAEGMYGPGCASGRGRAGDATGARLASSSMSRSVAPAARSRSPYFLPSTRKQENRRPVPTSNTTTRITIRRTIRFGMKARAVPMKTVCLKPC